MIKFCCNNILRNYNNKLYLNTSINNIIYRSIMSEKANNQSPKIIYVDDTSKFDDTIKEYESIAKNGKLFVLCTGAYDNNGVSWCPDCNDAKPHIAKTLENAAKEYEVVMIECRIPREGYKGNPQHPYRVHNKLNLKGVPTLYLWSHRGRPTRTLVEGQCADEELLEEMWSS